MSDEQPPDVGSRRRRREIREARERATAEQRERESAVRRLSSAAPSSTDGPAARPESEPSNGGAAPYDQEADEASSEKKPEASDDPAPQTRRSRRVQRQTSQSIPVVRANRPFDAARRAEPEPKPAEPVPAKQLPGASAEQGETPAPLPSATPSTPFDEVVAPSPEEHHEEPEYFDDDHHGEQLGHFADDDWEDVDGHIDDDHDGGSVVVGASDFGRGYQVVTPMEGRTSRNILRARKAKRRRRNITLVLVLGIFAAMVVGVVLFVQSFLGDEGVYDYDTVAGESVEFPINDGDGLETIANRLLENDIVASRDAFQDALQVLDSEPVPQPGQVELREQMPAEDAVAALFGEGQATHYFGIAEGMRVDDALEQISRGTNIPMSELQQLSNNPQQFGLPEEAETLEGYLAVGEYRPEFETPAEEIIQEAVDLTFERLEEIGVTEEDEQWRTVIIASLIVAEANHSAPDDYALIAGAIENRLDPNQTETDGLLQIDAAVNYGLGLSGDLHFPEEERLNPDNAFNTYVHEGLPPGPIAAPSPSVLEAAANPADTDDFFWVTVNVETGETRFNETYAQHQEDVEVFNQYCEDNPGVCSPAEVEAAEDELEE